MTLPPDAKRVFEGKIFDVYHWEQELFDGSHETFERLVRPDSVCIIAIRDGKILLARELQPDWKEPKMSLLGGRVDPGEEPLAAAKRELREETGCTSEEWELLWQDSPYSKIQWTIHYYLAKDCTKSAEQQLDAGEKIEIVPMDFDGFVTTVLDEKFRDRYLTFTLLRMQSDDRLDEFKKRLL